MAISRPAALAQRGTGLIVSLALGSSSSTAQTQTATAPAGYVMKGGVLYDDERLDVSWR